MKKPLTQKIIESHLVDGVFYPGFEIGIRIDQTLTHDAVGALIYLQLDSFNIDEVQTELSASYLDHHILTTDPEDAQGHLYLAEAARKHGVCFSRAGNGVCHQVHLERFGRPGGTLLGSDSHTCTAGALAMLALGVGGCDVAMAMAGKPYYFTCPRVIKVDLKGELRPWVSAKDVVLHLLGVFQDRGDTDFILEYGGGGVAGLSLGQRATMANMAEECGALSAVFPSDRRTLDFLKSQQREDAWTKIQADQGAGYDQVIKIDLHEIIPMASKPHSPRNVASVRDLDTMKVDQVCIGTCTNSSLEDLLAVTGMLKGRKVFAGVDLVISPASRQVLQNLAQDGALASLMAAGARISEPGCGVCLGQTHKPPAGAVTLRTSNRNAPGRSGAPDAQVYLVSPQTAAAAALTGRITDPRDLEIEPLKESAPARILVDDGLFYGTKENAEPFSEGILKELHVGRVPLNDSLPDSITGRVSIKLGDGLTLDQILPGAQTKKYGLDPRKQIEFMFGNLDGEFAQRAKKLKGRGGHNLVVAGAAYGRGSTKEHAALASVLIGIKAVMAKSFEKRHLLNLINFGVLPLVFADEKAYDLIDQGDEIIMSQLKEQVKKQQKFTVNNLTKNTQFELFCHFSFHASQVILAGGAANYWFGE